MVSSINFKEIYIFLLIISAFISISIFEVFVVIGLLWLIFDFIKNRKFEGSLKIPITVFGITTVLSSALYFPKIISKAVEEGIFQFLYFFNMNITKKTISRIVTLFLSIGLLLIPLILYNYFNLGRTKAFWGGEFEVGQFYGMFSLISFFVSLYFFKKQNKRDGFIFLLISIVFFFILILSTKRSPILGFLVISYLTFFLLYKNNFFNKKIFWSLNAVLLIGIISGYTFLSMKDPRFQMLNKVITGQEEININSLNIIASSRVSFGIDGLRIIKNDIENGNYINLLIGHGVRAGLYLPHVTSPPGWERYESIFIISEFIEKGIIGLLAVLAVFYIGFKSFLSIKITNNHDVLALSLMIPLLIHLIGSIFTFFWDALLPMYLLLFKIGEVYFRNKSKT
ncbi:O-antigen ligase family protein [Persephonella sp.]